jgi:predicted transcriptional regulator
MPYGKLNGKGDKILELENRRKIFEIVKVNAGCHFREIERKSKIPHGTLKYHLNFLVKYKLIRQSKDGGNIRYFPIELHVEDMRLLGLLRQKSIRRIILILLSEKKCEHNEIVNFVKLSSSTVNWHMNHLVREKIVDKNSNGKTVSYKLSGNENEIVKLIISYQDSFLDSLVNKVVEMWDVN